MALGVYPPTLGSCKNQDSVSVWISFGLKASLCTWYPKSVSPGTGGPIRCGS